MLSALTLQLYQHIIYNWYNYQEEKADDNCIGKKRTLKTGCGTLHCEAFFDPETGQLLETYFSKGSSGGCNNFMIGLSRAISLCARGGIDVYSIVDQLKSSGTCPSYAVRSATKHDTSKGSSCKKLAEYEQFEEQGLLVRLPVKIGDDIYKIPSKANYDLNVLNGYKANNRVYHQKAYSIVFSQSGWFVQCDKDSIHAPNVICVDVEYGKTWFLTREEAEKKLEEMKNGKK